MTWPNTGTCPRSGSPRRAWTSASRNAALAHAHPEYRTDLLSKAIVHADALSGFLVACALVRPEKANGMKVSSVRKKLKDKAFAPGVAREDIHSVQEGIGLELDEFIGLGIEGLQLVADGDRALDGRLRPCPSGPAATRARAVTIAG